METNYRDEPNPIPGRHDKIFPMFEFEHKGKFFDLIEILKELSVYLGFISSEKAIPLFDYEYLCEKYKTNSLEAEHEIKIQEDYGDVVGILRFPERTHPFWNMAQFGYNVKGERLFNKCDFIICGIETFGAAERSNNSQQMRSRFLSISKGNYARLLFNEFGKDRVIEELESYLSLSMIDRYGAGIGFTRLYRAMLNKNLL